MASKPKRIYLNTGAMNRPRKPGAAEAKAERPRYQDEPNKRQDATFKGLRTKWSD